MKKIMITTKIKINKIKKVIISKIYLHLKELIFSLFKIVNKIIISKFLYNLKFCNNLQILLSKANSNKYKYILIIIIIIFIFLYFNYNKTIF